MQALSPTSRLYRSLAVLLVMLAGSVSLDLFSTQGPITIAIEIFIISAIGFSFIAVSYYHVVIIWRAVDFPWILTSFAAIVVSLVNISANDQKQYVSSARSDISKALSDIIYATRTIVTSDCETAVAGEARRPSPEPYTGACDQMKHYLPQIVHVSDELDGNKIETNTLKDWARKLSIVGDTKRSGSWQAQAAAASVLIATVDRYDVGLRTISASTKDSVEDFILSTRLRIWYFIMAFFVGLRLSKTTAEVLQAWAPLAESTKRATAATIIK